MISTRTKGVALAGATALISGVAVFVNSHGVAAYGDATAYTTAKNAMAAMLILAAFLAARPAGARLTRPARARQWWGLAFVAVFGGAVPFVLFFQGLASTASTQAAFVHKTLVVWVALLAVVALKERLSWWHLGAIGLLVLAQWGLAGDVGLVADRGTMLVAAATLIWAVEVVVSKRLLRGMTPWTLSITRMVGGSVALLAWSGATSSLGNVIPSTADQWAWVAVTGALLAGYVLTWHQALARAQAVDVTAVLVLGAVVTAALAGAGALELPWLLMLAAGGLVFLLPARRRAST